MKVSEKNALKVGVGVMLILLCIVEAFPQSTPQYARKIVDQLGSPLFHGRGYVENGDRLAATWIAQQYKDLGLKEYDEGYFQEFQLSVNTFPGQVLVVINGDTLQPGSDYLVAASSPTAKGTYEVINIKYDDILQQENLEKIRNANNQFLVIEKSATSQLPPEHIKVVNDLLNVIKFGPEVKCAGVMVLSEEKLTWSAAMSQTRHPVLEVKSSAVTGAVQQVTIDIEAVEIPDYTTQNVIGYLPGKVYPDSVVTITAHYDHLGKMGRNTYFPGANDNASGMAMLLSLARYYSKQRNRPYTLLFIATGAEEVGLVGARHFVDHSPIPLSNIKLLYNFDLAGTGEEGIQVVNGSVYQDWYDQLNTINKEFGLMAEVKIRGEACNSDHCLFYEKGVPSLYSYTLGGIQAYHDIYDRPQTLPLSNFESYFTLISKFLDGVMSIEN